MFLSSPSHAIRIALSIPEIAGVEPETLLIKHDGAHFTLKRLLTAFAPVLARSNEHLLGTIVSRWVPHIPTSCDPTISGIVRFQDRRREWEDRVFMEITLSERDVDLSGTRLEWLGYDQHTVPLSHAFFPSNYYLHVTQVMVD